MADVMKYLEKVAYLNSTGISKYYCSKFDDSYMTMLGQEGNFQFQANHCITENLTTGLGFSPDEQKWYGWSHRAIFGFGIGSKCKKGDCHYKAANLEDEIEQALSFWNDDHTKAEFDHMEKDGNIRLKLNEHDSTLWIVDLGRGEWTAKTLDDAKQMALDFKEGVN